MTDNSFDPTTEPLSPERLQRRADILENNLYGSIKHSEDNLKAWLLIPRRVSQPPVIVKAISQILLRFSITSDKLIEDITRTLTLPPSAGEHADFTCKTGRGGNTPPFRDVHVHIDAQAIKLTITGSKSVEGRNGEIDRFFFDNKRYPGKLRKDGSIDFSPPQGLMLNSTLETESLSLKNVYICGTSTVYLGKKLFEKRDALLSEKKSLDSGNREIRQAMGAIRSELLEKLKKLSRGVSDHTLVPSFKLLIQVLQSLSFKKAFLVLAHLRKHLNVITVDSIVKSFKNLEKLHGRIKEQDHRNADIDAGIQMLETRINRMEVVIHGRINTSATIRLYAHESEPVYLSSTIQRGKIQTIALSARFSLKDGLKITRTA